MGFCLTNVYDPNLASNKDDFWAELDDLNYGGLVSGVLLAILMWLDTHLRGGEEETLTDIWKAFRTSLKGMAYLIIPLLVGGLLVPTAW